MDHYLDEQNSINRLVEEWRHHGKIIIAYDFDDTVYDFHKKDRQYNDVMSLLKRCDSLGAYFVVFTSCSEEKYDMIRNYLNQNELPYDKINENLDFIKFTGRKVYYNILLDDRAGLPSSYRCLLETIKIIEKEKIHE